MAWPLPGTATPDHARDLVEGFDALPATAQDAILLEIGLEPRCDGGEEHALERLNRIEERLSEDDIEQVADWMRRKKKEKLQTKRGSSASRRT